MTPKSKKTFQVRVERTVRQFVTLTLPARDEKAALNAAERMFREGEILHWGAPSPVSTDYQIVEPPKEP
jgi:hypothetical protein